MRAPLTRRSASSGKKKKRIVRGSVPEEGGQKMLPAQDNERFPGEKQGHFFITELDVFMRKVIAMAPLKNGQPQLVRFCRSALRQHDQPARKEFGNHPQRPGNDHRRVKTRENRAVDFINEGNCLELFVQLTGHGVEAVGQLFELVAAVNLHPALEVLGPDPSGPLLKDRQRGQCFPDEKQGKQENNPEGKEDHQGKGMFELKHGPEDVGGGGAEDDGPGLGVEPGSEKQRPAAGQIGLVVLPVFELQIVACAGGATGSGGQVGTGRGQGGGDQCAAFIVDGHFGHGRQDVVYPYPPEPRLLRPGDKKAALFTLAKRHEQVHGFGEYLGFTGVNSCFVRLLKDLIERLGAADRRIEVAVEHFHAGFGPVEGKAGEHGRHLLAQDIGKLGRWLAACQERGIQAEKVVHVAEAVHQAHGVALALFFHPQPAVIKQLLFDPLVGVADEQGGRQEGAQEKQEKKAAGESTVENRYSELHSVSVVFGKANEGAVIGADNVVMTGFGGEGGHTFTVCSHGIEIEISVHRNQGFVFAAFAQRDAVNRIINILVPPGIDGIAQPRFKQCVGETVVG